MELYQVEYFVVLAKTLNFTRAAEQCGVTQSALTRGIQRLERELGGELLFRERHLTQLTELGKAVLPMLRKTSEAATAARRSAHEYRRKAIAPLRLGLAPTISANLIVGLLTEVVRKLPCLRIETCEERASTLVDMLLEGKINVALAGQFERPSERIDHWPLFTERYVVLASPDHALSRRETVGIEDLAAATLLERDGCELGSGLQGTAETVGIRHRSGNESHLQHMAAAGFGVMLSPDHAPRLPSLLAIPLEGDPLRRNVNLLAVAGRRYSPGLDAFIKLAREHEWPCDGARMEATPAVMPM